MIYDIKFIYILYQLKLYIELYKNNLEKRKEMKE